MGPGLLHHRQFLRVFRHGKEVLRLGSGLRVVPGPGRLGKLLIRLGDLRRLMSAHARPNEHGDHVIRDHHDRPQVDHGLVDFLDAPALLRALVEDFLAVPAVAVGRRLAGLALEL